MSAAREPGHGRALGSRACGGLSAGVAAGTHGTGGGRTCAVRPHSQGGVQTAALASRSQKPPSVGKAFTLLQQSVKNESAHT